MTPYMAPAQSPRILGTGHYFPTDIVTNTELCGPAGVTEDWIIAKTGIVTRRRVAADQATSDVAFEAALVALRDANLTPNDISQIVVSTSTPDILGFPVASQVATLLDCPLTVGTYDMNAACSGFLTALAMSQRALRDSNEIALVIGADVYSRYRNPADKRSTGLWGDGAGAAIVGGGMDEPQRGAEIVATWFTRFPTPVETGGIQAGGSRTPATTETVTSGDHYVSLDGRRIGEIFKDNAPRLLDTFLTSAGVDRAEIDHVIPHQGNQRLVESIAGLIGVEPERVHATADLYGNTGSATIPTTLDLARQAGKFKSGDLILLFSIGIGMTFAFTLLRWS